MLLSDRFSDALVFATSLHGEQVRKGTDIPYAAHLLAVSAFALEGGADEDTAIAALLHDAVEDQGGLATADLIRSRFGERVADMVMHCSDSVVEKGQKAPWQVRKEAYVARLADADPAVALITTADKLHNLTAIVRDVRRDGAATLERFSASPTQIVWYYGAVADAVARTAPQDLVAELRRKLWELCELLDPQTTGEGASAAARG